MMGQILSGAANISLILQLTKERADSAQFSLTLFHSRQVLLSKFAGFSTGVSFLLLLSPDVWTVFSIFTACFVVIALVIAAFYNTKGAFRSGKICRKHLMSK